MTSVERGLQTARKVVTFGEIMLRLSPPGVERFLQSPVLSATFGGGEANVAVSLAHFGCDSVYVTALPTHAIGEAAVHALRAEGVRTDHIVRSGSRVGIYFAETGASQRASTVIYDRAHSAISELTADAVDWERRPVRRRVVSRHGHHAGTGIERRRGYRARHPRGPRGRCAGQLRSELSPKAVDRSGGAAHRRPAPEGRRSRRRQRGGPPVRARHSRRRHRRRRGAPCC